MSHQAQRLQYIPLLISALIMCMLVPLSAFAQVRINEVAWMGDQRSYTNEWIELYNASGQSVQLDGWRLNTQDGSITITLEGTLSAGEHFLLERTDDTAAQSASADQVYAGSLANEGNTLQLYDAAGTRVEKVAGGEEWEAIGGDNQTKDTAQYTPSGWITAAPTPGEANSTQPADDTDEESAGSNSQSDTQHDSKTAHASSPTPADPGSYTKESTDTHIQRNAAADPEFGIEAGGDRVVAAGANVIFEARAQAESDFTTYRWNFGNGAQKHGKQVWYAYPTPGRYVVTVTATNGNEQDSDRFTLTAFAPEISIAAVESGIDGFIKLRNKTDRDIDLSGWHLQAGDEFFTFPNGTIMLASQSIAYPHSATKLHATKPADVRLLYPNGKTATKADTTEADTQKPKITYASAQVPHEENISTANDRATTQSVTSKRKNNAQQSTRTPADTATTSSQAAALSSTDSSLFGWLAALVSLLLGAAVLVLWTRQSQQKERTEKDDIQQLASEFDIIEDSQS